MTIEEAIQHADQKAEQLSMASCNAELQGCDREALRCNKCASEHRQLAGWLRELKKLRETVKKYKDSYNKGFDDGVKALQANLELCAEEMEQEKLPGNVAKASEVLMKLIRERTCDNAIECCAKCNSLDVIT